MTIPYKPNSYTTLQIDPSIMVKLLEYDQKITKLKLKDDNIDKKKKQLEKQLDQQRLEKLRPYREKSSKIWDKINTMEKEKKVLIESHCEHKTYTRWYGGDYNEHLRRFCEKCGKDYGEVD